MTDLERARAQAAEQYPEHLEDSMGRKHRCIPREAILKGGWDDGPLVRAFLAALEGK